jgi:hypothetical protein
MASSIESYLTELARALSGPRRHRRRVIAEARDHLWCATEAHVDAGAPADAAQREAIARFGAPREIAAAHARRLARNAVAVAAMWSAVAAAAFVGLVVVTTQLGGVRDGVPARAIEGGAAGAVGWIAVQLVAACAAVTVVRVWLLRGEPAAHAGDLRLVQRGHALVLATVGVSLALDLDAFRRMPAGQGDGAEVVFGLALLAGAGWLAAAAGVVRAQRRVRALDRLAPREAPTLDIVARLLDGVVGAATRVASMPIVGRLARPGASAMVVAAGWYANPRGSRRGRQHLAVVALACAAAAGFATALAHLVAEGPSTHGLLSDVVVVGVLVAVEGTVAIGCLLAVAVPLGVWRPTDRHGRGGTTHAGPIGTPAGS